MKIIDLIKKLRKKFLITKSKNKLLIKILEISLEKNFINWNYNEKIHPSKVKISEKLCEFVFNKSFPIQYLQSIVTFGSLQLYINPFTLIPRPETEMIVEKIYNYLKKEEIFQKYSKIILLDFGTGSGNIILYLLKLIKNNIKENQLKSIAFDISFKTLKTALKNSILNNLDTVFINTENLEILKIPQNYYFILISNPPYLTRREFRKELFFEPSYAIFTPKKTLFYKKIINFFTNKKDIKDINFSLFFEIDQKALKLLIKFLLKNNLKNNFHFSYENVQKNIFIFHIHNQIKNP
ncbi:MAG: hypothetical protein ACK4ZM_02130 [bacterium]